MVSSLAHRELLSVLSLYWVFFESQEGSCMYQMHFCTITTQSTFSRFSVASQERSYSCYMQSLLIWGGGRGSPGLVCNFPAWLMPPTHHRNQKQGQIYICEGAARRGRAAVHRPVFTAQLQWDRPETSETISVLRKNTYNVHTCTMFQKHCIMGRLY